MGYQPMQVQDITKVLDSLEGPLQGYSANPVKQGSLYTFTSQEAQKVGLELETRVDGSGLFAVQVRAKNPIMHTGNFPWTTQPELDYLIDSLVPTSRKSSANTPLFSATGVVFLPQRKMVATPYQPEGTDVKRELLRQPFRDGESPRPYENRIFGIDLSRPLPEKKTDGTSNEVKVHLLTKKSVEAAVKDTYDAAQTFLKAYRDVVSQKQSGIDGVLFHVRSRRDIW